MESILAILCIVFFVVLTYGLIQGANLQKFHKHNCRTIYIPESIDLETAFRSVQNLTIDDLKKRGRDLGATKEFTDKQTEIELKIFIIQNSISEDHILFDDISEDINKRDLIQNREYCRDQIRNHHHHQSCPSQPNPTLGDYSDVIIPQPTNLLEEEHILLTDPSISIEQMREDIDDYTNKNITIII